MRAPVPRWLTRLSMESPFRLLARAMLARMTPSVGVRELWGLSSRPAYLTGLLAGARLARELDVPEIIAIEFGVAGGEGLLAMQQEAEAVERQLGVKIKVVGFDTGMGLPELTGDYRDHPDYWKQGDFPLNEAALRAKLSPRTRLILGDVRDNVSEFVLHIQDAPIGFVSFDLDLYSSTTHALQVLSHEDRWMLPKVPLYFDDVDEHLVSHRFAGELLAIDEFNEMHATVKIDRWRGIKVNRPFPEDPFLDRMYVAFDLEAISGTRLERDLRQLPLEASR